jgi:hypothetical protein
LFVTISILIRKIFLLRIDQLIIGDYANKFTQKLQSKWIEAPTLGSVESLIKKNMFFFIMEKKIKL